MPKYRVTVIYTAEPVIEVEAEDIYQAQRLALEQAGAFDIETTTDVVGSPTTHGRTEVVEVAGRKIQLDLISWYAGPIKDGGGRQ